MKHKPVKDHSEVESYRPIELLLIMSKLFEKLILKRLKKIIQKYHLVPTHQFEFRNNHSTMDQVRRITDITEKILERKRICSAAFSDISQASNRNWRTINSVFNKKKLILSSKIFALEFRKVVY